MTKIKDFAEVVPTAIQSIYPRTFTDIKYSDKIYTEIGKYFPNKEDDLIVDNLSIQREARHKIIDKLLVQNNAEQIFEFAAGYSPRGLVFSENPNIQYVELDLPDVYKVKTKIIQDIARGRKNLHIIDGNVLDRNDLTKIDKYFTTDKPVVIINEGFLRYLDFAEKAELAQSIRSILEKYGGVWITGDGAFRNFRKNEDKTLPDFNKKLSNRTSRNDIRNVFDDKDAFVKFYSDLGFSVEFHRYDEVLGELVSPQKLIIKKMDARQFIQDVYAIVLKIKS
jgi:O-methyltransferase involved in polyketide biosynthesis